MPWELSGGNDAMGSVPEIWNKNENENKWCNRVLEEKE
jgi:hypothetical protein